ncbi:ATP-binding protein [Hydrogenophaga laconesensis]|uniref:Signal transduction histidine-protein kinase/phosphatase MprB n=1 Tax=Hydrogenophaga laconesensis TaxID=1805971 RepID=A0ABU1V9U6_9BURK|nr:ATP-binding protein [Hydrogenophaga laconesensis]MDR7094202.1 two-component system sensor histidine kinase BaeS [Hydrogenophaga laconesensis]
MPTDHPAPSPRPRGWLSRFDTLRVKLFLAIAGANVVLVMTAYLIYSWSFDKGLVEYLNKADENRLQPMIVRLAEGYRQNGNWAWITEDRQRWQDLSREVLGTGRMPRRPGELAPTPPAQTPSDAQPHNPSPQAPPAGAPPSGPPAPNVPPTFTIDPRLLLLDPQRNLLAGPEGRTEQAVLKAIVVNEQVVGYLGYVPRLQMVASLERVFLAQQTRTFAAIALGMLAAVLLNAALIARWLSRRLRVLGDGTAAVAQGDYSVRLPTRGHDELAQLAEAFNHMATSLQAAQQARQQWIADIAHELRTPLATLRAEIEALQDGIRQPDTANLDSLAQEVSRLTRLVEDLRLLSLSDLGALDYRFAPLDLGRFVGHHLNDAASLSGTPLHVRTELEQGVEVRADGDRLDQVLNNLLQNTLRYSASPATLQVEVRRHDTEAQLTWEDTAPGVPPAALPRLTERLYRVDESRASASGGSGLGLAIAHAIIEGHGGRMQASASPLGGLRWDIWLPLNPEPANA